MAYIDGTSALQILEPVFEVIEGGAEVATENVTSLIADNGAKIIDFTTKEVYSANGSATFVSQAVRYDATTEAAVTAEAGFFAMDVGALGAALAPALGLIGGIALYDLAPEFWTSVSEKLVEAGQTVGGKVIAFFNKDGQTSVSKETIEIMKNAFLESGVFDTTYNLQTTSAILNTNNTTTPDAILQYSMLESCRLALDVGRINQDTYSAQVAQIPTAINNINKELNLQGISRIAYWIAVPLTKTLNGTDVAIGLIGIQTPLNNLGVNARYNYDYDSGDGFQISFSEKVDLIRVYLQNFNTEIPNITLQTEQTKIEFIGSWFSRIYSYYRFFVSDNFINNVADGAIVPGEEEFTQTYPTWQPMEYPEEIPQQYPLSMPDPDNAQNPSQQGQNDTAKELQELIDKLFETLPAPSPDVEIDPDASTVTEPEPAPKKPEPETNPPDPNPTPTPSPSPVPLPILDTVSADRMFTVYRPTDAQVNSLGAFLWTNDIIEQIKKLWDDPMQAVISFHKIYAAPVTGGIKNIVLGYIDSGVGAAVVTSQFTDVDCGTVQVPERLHNATDYSPFTTLHIYLPFVGIVELDTNECMNAYLHVKYRVDVYTGTCVALIYARRTVDLPQEQLLYSFSGNCAQTLPLTASSFAGAISALLGLAGAGVSVASGGAMGIAAGAMSAAHSLTQEMVHIQHSGGLSSNAGILSPRTPFLILSRQYGYDASAYAQFYGYPANKTVYIGNCSGFIKCKEVIFNGTCTQTEAEEIVSLLKDGVYL